MVLVLVLSGCGGEGGKPSAAGPKLPPPPKLERLFTLHSVGTGQLASNTNATGLRELGSSPASVALFASVRARVAPVVAGLLGSGSGGGDVESLLDDAVGLPARVDVRAVGQAPAEWVVAVRTGAERGGFWQTNLWPSLTGSNTAAPTRFSIDGGEGWVSGSTRLGRVGDWTLVGVGSSNAVTWTEALAWVAGGGGIPGVEAAQASDVWFKLETSLTALNRRIHWLPDGVWPEAQVSVSLRNGRLRTEAVLKGANLAPATLSPWSVPLQVIHDDPLVSFSAMRNLDWVVKGWPITRAFQLESVPSQIFFWTEESTPPILNYFAARVDGVTNLMQRLAERMPTVLSSAITNQSVGRIVWATNRTGVVWEGIPVALPFLRPMHEPAGEFLVGGLWPLMPSTNDMPRELLAQLDRSTNLVYYEWESTRRHLSQVRSMSQLSSYVVTPYNTPPTNSLPERWLEEVGDRLDRVVTEATAEDPGTLKVVRTSQLGLDSAELLMLVQWLRDPAFPGGSPAFGYRPDAAFIRRLGPAPSQQVPAPAAAGSVAVPVKVP